MAAIAGACGAQLDELLNGFLIFHFLGHVSTAGVTKVVPAMFFLIFYAGDTDRQNYPDAPSLAREFEVSSRTIKRDIETEQN